MLYLTPIKDFETPVKKESVSSYLLVKQVVDLHCNQVNAIK